jgi:hypothetical protein
LFNNRKKSKLDKNIFDIYNNVIVFSKAFPLKECQNEDLVVRKGGNNRQYFQNRSKLRIQRVKQNFFIPYSLSDYQLTET